MNTLQIDYFLMIADSESFTAAAQKLHVSQPAVSRVIAALENELGCVLFDRRNHKAAVLTPAGRMFYDTFHQIRQSISDTIQKVNELTETKSGTFSIGVRSGLDISSWWQNYWSVSPNVTRALQFRLILMNIKSFVPPCQITELMRRLSWRISCIR